MKNVISKTRYVLMALIIALTVSCNGEDGAIGPPGPAGQNGTNGNDGIDGNANVTSVTMAGTSFIDGENNYSVSELTQDILDTGVVIGYLRNSGASTWFALPLSFSGFEVFIQSMQLGTITLRANYNGNDVDLRFVFIESTNKSAAKLSKQSVLDKLKAAEVDINNYNEVMDYYGLDY